MGCGESSISERQNFSEPSQPNNKYIRKELIGKGTYGLVYRCLSTVDNKQYAMKVVKINSQTRQEAVKEIDGLKSQISMLKKLNHPNIVKYHSFDVTNDLKQVQIVLELVSEGSLKSYIEKNGPLSQKQTAQISKDILQGLVYLHNQSIIHRDLKCANILIDSEKHPKITDFGTAKVIIEKDLDDIAKLSASLKGTPYYMAPEILKRTGHNQNADIWSFGCMVIEMLTGKAPWTTLNSKFSQVIGFISSGIHPPFPPNITKQCEYFLQSCLNPRPNQRLQAKQLLHHRFIMKYTQNEKISKVFTKQRHSNIDILREQEEYNPQEVQRLLQNNSSQPRKVQIIHPKPISKIELGNVKETKRKKNVNIMQSLDKIVAEIDELSDEEIILKEHYHVKKRTQRNSHRKKNSKTTGTIKNSESNIMQNPSFDGYASILNQHDKQVINTKISKMQRDNYEEEREVVKRRKQQNKRQWQEQLQKGAQIFKYEITSRYH